MRNNYKCNCIYNNFKKYIEKICNIVYNIKAMQKVGQKISRSLFVLQRRDCASEY